MESSAGFFSWLTCLFWNVETQTRNRWEIGGFVQKTEDVSEWPVCSLFDDKQRVSQGLSH